MIDTDAEGLTIRKPDGHRSYFHYIWLRNCCYCDECGSAYTGERFLQPSDVPLGIQAKKVVLEQDQQIVITWDDGHVSRYDLEWLSRCGYSTEEQDRKRYRPRTWDHTLTGHCPEFNFDHCQSSEETCLEFLRAVRDFGFAVMHGCPLGELEIETVAGLIGEVANAAYSKIFDLKPDHAHSLGNTFHPVAPHTDEAYLHTPTGILILYCLHPASDGGDTVLVDGFNLGNRLREQHPQSFEILKNQPQTFMRVVPGDNVFQYARSPSIVTDEYDNIVGVRFHTRTLAPLDVDPAKLKQVHKANSAMSKLMLDPRNQVTLKMESGDAVIFDNHRVLHSRTGFSDPKRHLQICNVSRENFHQKLRFTASRMGFIEEANQVLPAGVSG